MDTRIKISLEDCCKSGSVEDLLGILGNPESNLMYNEELDFILTKGFQLSAYNGNFELLKYLLTSPNLPRRANIHHESDYALVTSAMNGYLEQVEYLLTSSELTEHADIQGMRNCALIWSSGEGQLNVVKYLLSSPKLTSYSNINAQNSSCKTAFIAACERNHLSVAKYLFGHSDFDSKNGMYVEDIFGKNSFIYACEIEEDTKMVEFLIVDCKICLTEKMKNYIQQNKNNQTVVFAKKLLEARDLKLALEKDMCHILSSERKTKI